MLDNKVIFIAFKVRSSFTLNLSADTVLHYKKFNKDLFSHSKVEGDVSIRRQIAW
jgi:hypothetical protein